MTLWSTCRLVRPPTSRKNRGKLFYVTQMKNDMLLMTVPTSLGHRWDERIECKLPVPCQDTASAQYLLLLPFCRHWKRWNVHVCSKEHVSVARGKVQRCIHCNTSPVQSHSPMPPVSEDPALHLWTSLLELWPHTTCQREVWFITGHQHGEGGPVWGRREAGGGWGVEGGRK